MADGVGARFPDRRRDSKHISERPPWALFTQSTFILFVFFNLYIYFTQQPQKHDKSDYFI